MHRNQGTDLSCELRELLASEDLGPEQGSMLLALMDDYISQTDAAVMDADLVDAGLAKLWEFAPKAPEFDKAAGLARLLDAMDERETRSVRRRKRAGRVAGILAACMAVFMLAANAFGINPIQYAHEFAETVSFWLSPSGNMILPPEEVEAGFSSLREALDADGVDIGLPVWIPVEFDVVAVDVYEIQNSTNYFAGYTSSSKELRIQVVISDTDIIRTDEKENGGYDYVHRGETYYILPNTDNVKAFWAKGACALTISGQISEKEMEKVIDSIR